MRLGIIGVAALLALSLTAPVRSQTGVSYSFTPTSGPIGSSIHVTGTGCPPTSSPPPSGGDLSFALANGPGRSQFYESNNDGSFAFDYVIPSTRPGEQTADNRYDTSIFCFSNNQEVGGQHFTITGPEYTMTPASGPPGTTVQFSGLGCFHDESVQDDGTFVFSEGQPPVPFDAGDDHRFTGTFTVPNVAPGSYTTRVTCYVQGQEAPGGQGGQQLTGTAPFTVTAQQNGTTTTTSLTTSTTLAPATTTTTTAPGTATVSQTVVPPGGQVTVSGDGFAPGQSLTVDLDSTANRLAVTQSDSAGRFSARVTIPRTTSQGAHRLIVSGPDPAGRPRQAIANITVAGTLPVTGGDAGNHLGIGALSIGVGALLVGLAAYRRRIHSTAASRIASLLR